MLHHSQLQSLFEKLNGLTLFDEYRLKHKLQVLCDRTRFDENDLVQWEEQLNHAKQRFQLRQKHFLEIEYDSELPVVAKRNELMQAIREHQVVIIAGETGSGKTTQLPKICLELGLGMRGFIGHTQPRRIAARSIAARISEELKTDPGDKVGFKVRFNDNVSSNTLIKLMTDGILLVEIQHDPLLLHYDTLIIDEAHERSLNIDFILGYLKQILPKRPDLKIIITSATLDPERLSIHFNRAPIFSVSGRTYPVEIRYWPQENDPKNEEGDQITGIVNAVKTLQQLKQRGDILVFLSGEREIRDTADALALQDLKHTEILPLYARLSIRDQNRIFQPHTGNRVVLATNVAETSLTVPGIKYVIDTGLARISRYSVKTKVQRLPIEAISQASANQRAGRCGRTSEGICIRLYDESDYLNRPLYTDPEILRTNLAAVILQMAALKLGDIEAFPFVDAPDKRQIQDGIRLLEELGAIHTRSVQIKLTEIGRLLARFPLDPRLGRMILEARKQGCLKEVTVIAAGLSILDPCERPPQKQQTADEKHKRFASERSDFLRFLNLWNYIEIQQKELTSNQFRKLCQKEYLNYLRIREWQDLTAQLHHILTELHFPLNPIPGDAVSIHIAILSGLLSHIGLKEGDISRYSGARNIHFFLQPGSVLFKTSPKWCVVNELIETSRLWGRCAARIESEWIEPLAEHLARSTYSEPHWSKRQGAVLAYEKVTLFGLPIVGRRIVNYRNIDQTLSRKLFIRHGLVEADWSTNHYFYQRNRDLIERVERLEHKSRRRDILIDEDRLFDFYDERIPQHVASSRDFDTWWDIMSKNNEDYLNFTEEMLINPGAAEDVTPQRYPDIWHQNHFELDLVYEFDPSSNKDGVTVIIPIAILNQINEAEFDWQIPGLRQDLIIALIKSLPKSLRRNLVPAPHYARAFLERVTPYEHPLRDTLEIEFLRMTGISIDKENWEYEKIPSYLRMTFRIVDDTNAPLLEGKDLKQLKNELKGKIEQHISAPARAKGIEKRDITDWDFGVLPKEFEDKRQGYTIKAYPALLARSKSVEIQLVTTYEEQQTRSLMGLRRLLLLNLPSPIQYLHETLPNKSKLGLYFASFGTVNELIDDCIAAAVDTLIQREGGMIWNESDFQSLLSRIKGDINPLVAEIAEQVQHILTQHFQINKRLKGYIDLSLAFSLGDIKKQLSHLIYNGFVSQTGYTRLADISRYLNAVEIRLEKLGQNSTKDAAAVRQITQVESAYQNVVDQLPESKHGLPDVVKGRWMIEELRVNLFAQHIKIPYPISEKRIREYLEKIKKTLAI